MILTVVLFSSLLFEFVFINSQVSTQRIYNELDTDEHHEEFYLKIADTKKPLSYSAMYRNATTIRQVFQSVNFTINASAFTEAASVKMQIKFSNNTAINYSMTQIGSTTNWTRTYTPAYYAPLGFQIVTFYILNVTPSVINTQTTSSNFSIISNSMASFNSSQYLRNQYALADLTLYDYTNYNWKISVVDSSYQNTKFNLGTNLFRVQFQINTSFDFVNSFYYLKVNITQKIGTKWACNFFQFRITNTNPKILVSTVKFDPNPFYRGKSCKVTLNVSDIENNANPSSMNVKMTLEDPEGGIIAIPLFTNNNDGSFKWTFSISTSKPAGHYKVNITATDQNGGQDSYITSLTVLNNPPKIESYKINDYEMDESISIRYGEDLKFTFEVTDEEGLGYITVALLNEDDEWYNITRSYEEDMDITVRTIDLITGTWYVYIFVTDSDGETVGLDFDYDVAPQEITVIPDTLSTILPWVLFGVGVAIGVAVGAGIIVALRRKKAKTTAPTSVSEKEPQKKSIPAAKTEAVKSTAPVEKVEKKNTIKKGAETIEKKPVEPSTQRKIKRRLK